MLLAYAAYINPVNLGRALLNPSNKLYLAGVDDQRIGMMGLAKTAIRPAVLSYRLWRGPITRETGPPGPKTRLMDISPAYGGRADSAPKAARRFELVQLDVGQV